MKKTLAIFLVLIMMLSAAACGSSATAPTGTPAATDTPAPTEVPVESTPEVQEPAGDRTLGEQLQGEFINLVAGGTTDPQAIADALLQYPAIEFAGAAMPVEPGYLAGFSAEIHDFKEGVMFAPMIGSIPFVGYIFVTEGEAEAEALVQTLLDNADPRWNICVEADETVAWSEGDLVFFVMCPKQ